MGMIGGATGALVGRLTAGHADEITESAAPADAATEALDEAIEAASDSAMFDAGTD
jgi:argininosuccinate synthase